MYEESVYTYYYVLTLIIVGKNSGTEFLSSKASSLTMYQRCK